MTPPNYVKETKWKALEDRKQYIKEVCNQANCAYAYELLSHLLPSFLNTVA